MTFTAGASFDSISGDAAFVPDGGDVHQFNPKFGIAWNPFPGTTVRAAVFRVFKRTLITDQTLEPTQIAGFNQFFDDVNATDAWRYGGAIDQKFTNNIFGGVEFSKRDKEIPIVDISSDPGNIFTRTVDAEEYLGRAYFLWAPHAWLSLRAEYIFERFKNDEVFGNQPLKLNTHRVPLGINFFHPSGLSAFLTATYWNQDGKFEKVVDGIVQSGSSDFWTLDAFINYRLPKRYGFISVGATNLFNEKFKFFEVDFDNPRIIPKRQFLARITLALP